MEALAALFLSMQEQISSANCKVPKINERNYVRWKRDMTIYLKASNLWDVVTSDPPDPSTAEWTRKNQRAVAEIHNCCDPIQQDLFSDYDQAKAAWDKLKSTYEMRDAATIQRLYNDFNNIKKSNAETMLTYIARVKTAAKLLTNAGETVSATNLINKTISGLSDRYEAVKVYLGMLKLR